MCSSSSSGGSSLHNHGRVSRGQAKRSRLVAAQIYLRERLENGEVFPVVEIVVNEGEEAGVVEYVTKCMKREIFIELMEMMA